MELDQKLLSKAKYNVLKLKPQSSVLRSFKDLKEWPEFMVDYEKEILLNKESILRFCLLFYQRSDFHNIESDIMKRKRIAAEWAGFDISGGKFTEKVEDILLGKNTIVNMLIVRVLRLTSNSTFQQYIVFEETRARLYMKLYEDSGGKNESVKDILQNIETLSKKIEEMERSMLKEDRYTLIKDALYTSATKESMPTPEAIAEARKSGTIGDIIDPPYGEEHIVYGGKKKLS